MHWYMTQRYVRFQFSKHLVAIHSGKINIEHDGMGAELAGKCQSCLTCWRNEAFESLVPRLVAKHCCELCVILDHQYDLVVGCDCGAVIINDGIVDRFIGPLYHLQTGCIKYN